MNDMSARDQIILENLKEHENGQCLIWQGFFFTRNNGCRAWDGGRPFDVKRHYWPVFVPQGWVPHWRSTDACPSRDGRCLTEGHWELDVVREIPARRHG